MATFKLTIAEPTTGRSFKKEVTGPQAERFIGLNIGEKIAGDDIGFAGYEFLITGGSDTSGFPMRRGILGTRKKITLLGGVGYRPHEKGVSKRKTVCGHKIHDGVAQINLKTVTAGAKSFIEILGLVEAEVKPGRKAKKEKKKEPVPVKPSEAKTPEA